MKILVVVDMQKDFIDGALGTPEAIQIVPYVKKVIESFEGKVLFTRDTHFEDYMDTQEGRNLPVKHCIKGSFGWEVYGETAKALAEVACYLDPQNPEYRRALDMIRSRSTGYGQPYRTTQSGGGMSACDCCSSLMCADCCCECMGGDLIRCC